MFISVIICSRDRAQSLGETLNTLFVPGNLAVPDWEVLVAYGPNESGETEICRKLDEKFPGRLHYWLRKEEGKSEALNTAFAKARGEIFALTDDDVIIFPNFLSTIRSTFETYDVDGVQGRILLDCEGGRPKWMGDELSRWMSERDYGDRVFEWNENLTGTNMIFRAEVVRRIGGFAPELGAGAVGFAEDSEFSMRMRKARYKLLYIPEILVYHRLPVERLTKASFRERFFRFGKTEAFLNPLRWPLWRFGLYSFKTAIFAMVQSFWLQITSRPVQSVLKQCQAYQVLGTFRQYVIFQRKGSKRHSLYKAQTQSQ
jgi:cellulose synthase/poly-beta-1,6-N-acetylglucosamine synthase-like glycosyltransferase